MPILNSSVVSGVGWPTEFFGCLGLGIGWKPEFGCRVWVRHPTPEVFRLSMYERMPVVKLNLKKLKFL